MDNISEQFFAIDLSNLPSWKNSNIYQKKEVLKSFLLEFYGLFPLLPFYLHLFITVFLPSDCNLHNNTLTITYLILLHLLTFISELIYYTPFNKSLFSSGILKFSILKSLLITFNLFVLSLIRAKPYKCILSFNPVLSVFLLVFSISFSLFFSLKIDTFVKNKLNVFKDIPTY